jgi:hypothetical protein
MPSQAKARQGKASAQYAMRVSSSNGGLTSKPFWPSSAIHSNPETPSKATKYVALLFYALNCALPSKKEPVHKRVRLKARKGVAKHRANLICCHHVNRAQH